jgi:hypothetical protein
MSRVELGSAIEDALSLQSRISVGEYWLAGS